MIGSIEIELLKDGLSSAMGVELTPTYEAAATSLLAAAGLRDRVERADVPAVDLAVLVVLNRVICRCPDVPRLAGAAADDTSGVVVMSFPNARCFPGGRWWTRLTLGNVFLRVVARRQLRSSCTRPPRSWRWPSGMASRRR